MFTLEEPLMREWMAFSVNCKTKGRGLQSRTEREQCKRGGCIREEASSGQCMFIALNQGESNAYNRMENLRLAYS